MKKTFGILFLFSALFVFTGCKMGVSDTPALTPDETMTGQNEPTPISNQDIATDDTVGSLEDYTQADCATIAAHHILSSETVAPLITLYENKIQGLENNDNELEGYDFTIEMESEDEIHFALVEEYPDRNITVRRFQVNTKDATFCEYDVATDSCPNSITLGSPEEQKLLKAICELPPQ